MNPENAEAMKEPELRLSLSLSSQEMKRLLYVADLGVSYLRNTCTDVGWERARIASELLDQLRVVARSRWPDFCSEDGPAF